MQTTTRTQLAAATTLAASLLVLTACGTEATPGGGGGRTVAADPEVAGVHWSVESVTADGRKTTVPPGAYLRIDPKTDRAEGDLGCNRFSAGATVKGDTVTLSKPTSTLLSCTSPDGKRGEAEQALRTVLNGPLTARVAAGKLTLTGKGGDTVRLFDAPPAKLVGPTWEITSRYPGTPAPGKAKLVFGKDGTVRGTLGCNRFSATFTTPEPATKAAPEPSGGTTEGALVITRPVTTRMLCQGAAGETEKELLKVLKGGLSYRIDHRKLVLRTSGDSAPGGNAGLTAYPVGG
ncbi:META domain-containing protein [Streptomyces sp. LP05-1]|uniref:META domain-containing protein n=1 Tax=Streptomyces pyxinae TaxID=2970734 RepID=A0ABT2CN54_9ACTN|nr:META domain-containing protein [Streptomyces sp. LP05-1]MCS0638855.1 META domain-containing protein [Streptomyces sp. LP05-1]